MTDRSLSATSSRVWRHGYSQQPFMCRSPLAPLQIVMEGLLSLNWNLSEAEQKNTCFLHLFRGFFVWKKFFLCQLKMRQSSLFGFSGSAPQSAEIIWIWYNSIFLILSVLSRCIEVGTFGAFRFFFFETGNRSCLLLIFKFSFRFLSVSYRKYLTTELKR